MKKELLLIIYTHGDEPIGERVVRQLRQKKLNRFFDVLIANPRAARRKVRFIDVDMNRVYPGDGNAKEYEMRKAFENLRIAQDYKYVIDIHEASAGTDDFIIIPRETFTGTFPLAWLDLDRVLLWPDPSGPISQVLKNALELEFGMLNRDRKEVEQVASKIIEDFIIRMNSLQKMDNLSDTKQFYYVYGKLMQKDVKVSADILTDFENVDIDGESFMPLLSGQYLEREGIVCYKMRKLETRVTE